MIQNVQLQQIGEMKLDQFQQQIEPIILQKESLAVNNYNQMGIQSSNQSRNQSSLASLIHVRKLSESKTLYRNAQTSRLFVALERTFPSNQQLQNFDLENKKKSNVYHQHYLSPVDCITVTNSNICSKQHKIIQLFPYEPHSLWQQVENRMMHKKSFSSREIWSILCSCVLAMGHFGRNQVMHYTLSPHDIILNNEGNVQLLPMELSDYTFDYSIRQEYYYAPEMIKAMKCTSHINLNNNKAGVYTLAITILHLINLKPMNFLYDFQEMAINQDLLNKSVELILDDDIRNVLHKMIRHAPYERITFTELQQMLHSILESRNTQQDQLQKLQDSICRVHTDDADSFNLTALECEKANQNNSTQQFFFVCKPMQRERQDSPPSSVCYFNAESTIDFETHDQANTMQKYGQSTYRGQTQPLQEKSNFQNIKVEPYHPQSKRSVEFSRISAPELQNSKKLVSPAYFVTEQYNRGRYEGYKQGGMRHGFGTFYYQQGGKYNGQWVKNKMEGRGALYYTSGTIAYEGEWKKDQLHGYGVLYNENPKYIPEEFPFHNLDRVDSCWVKYEGNFHEDLKHGEGTLHLSNGETFTGSFQSDLPDGEGLYKTMRGHLITGIWTKGVYKGKTSNRLH